MMSYEADAHKHQMITLKHLLLRPDATFTELQKAMEAESDAANFHIKQLVQAGYITKNKRQRYTTRGWQRASTTTAQTALLWLLGPAHRED